MTDRTVILVVLDGVGVGELPDARSYGDQGTHTLGNVARARGGLRLPHLQSLGLARIASAIGLDPRAPVEGCFGRMAERSKGKDSTTGHWEIAGIITDKPFPVYPNGFPPSLIRQFLDRTGCKGVLGNTRASGTEIIAELGSEHVRTGHPIVYTSSDSVFQIAAHEDVIPPEQLYGICRKTRTEVVVGEHAVGRVIARPFVGTQGSFRRTVNRKDFSLPPPDETLLDLLQRHGIRTVSVGKVDDLFAGRGIDERFHTTSNREGIETVLGKARSGKTTFIMANLVDFDALYGHRQDADGFARALEEFDEAVPELVASLKEGDLLVITADHGNDPTDASTDHSREYVPLLCFSPSGQHGVDLGVRSSFADAGKTVAEFFGVSNQLAGESFLSMVVTS
ncbi:MAG: phosphopentomutase [Ignavibacteriales bacterium]|nr:phosphopentomutase [Ignavibacteriales bacterium]